MQLEAEMTAGKKRWQRAGRDFLSSRGDETHATSSSQAGVRKPRRLESGRKYSSNRAALAEDVFLRGFVKQRRKGPDRPRTASAEAKKRVACL